MKHVRIELHPKAQQEIEEAQEWYRERSSRAAEGFLNELVDGIALIRNAPEAWPSYEGGTRRYLPRSYPFSIIYRQNDQGVRVVAVAHHRRKPMYWRDRLR